MSATLAAPASPESALVRMARKYADEQIAIQLAPLKQRIAELESEIAALRSKKR